MVLSELGNRIAAALNSMGAATVIDQKVFDKLIEEVMRALLQSDVNARLAIKLRDNIRNSIDLDKIPPGMNKRKLIHTCIVNELKKLLDSGVKGWAGTRGKANVVMFIGLQGSGKTTTCTKFAYYYQKKGWKAALICADTFRAGAFDQLKQNATRAGIAYYGSVGATDPAVVAEDGVNMFKSKGFDMIVVDTSGRHRQEDALFDEMVEVHKAVKPDNVVFVMDSSIGQACESQARAFMNKVGFSSVIITKLDGHGKGGGALTAVASTNCNILFIANGERFTDLQPFKADVFINKLLGMGDIAGLVDKVAEIQLDDQQVLTKKLWQGAFTLRDLYEQFQNILQMGSVGDIMASIPGFSSFAGDGEVDASVRFKICITIMDSMTDRELDSLEAQKLFNKETTRYSRVARGAGRCLPEVHMVFKFYIQFTQLFKKMGGMKNMFTKDGEIKKNANANQMNQLVRNLGQHMDPRVIQQMGGSQGLSNVLKQFQQNPSGKRK